MGLRLDAVAPDRAGLVGLATGLAPTTSKRLVNPSFHHLFDAIRAEYERTVEAVLALTAPGGSSIETRRLQAPSKREGRP